MTLIGKYFNQRLTSAFADVAPNPYTLRNSQGSPLFLLCFAAANPRAAKTAIKIAQDILKRDPIGTPLLPTMEGTVQSFPVVETGWSRSLTSSKIQRCKPSTNPSPRTTIP